ncbi:MAG TPA: 9-O-acetylesterase, partial [Candidatus Binatia bacterium]|nr:9-O-acetylesterase [Candidatus Binatia bacterium]
MNSSSFARAVTVMALWAGASLQAAILLPKIIGDHMVLQRGVAAPIWGQATPGEKISVQADWQPRAISVTAGHDGKWLVKIPTPKAGSDQPHTIIINGDHEKIVLHDVLVGEVWVCSGQSNMEFPVGYAYGAYSGATNWEQELQHADFPAIRLFTVENSFALSPQFDCKGQWLLCNSNSAKVFSAVAYFFGRELHEKLKVPIGLVDSDFGGTVCEAWTSADTLKQFPDFAAGLKTVEMERTHSNELAQAAARELSEWATQIVSAADLAAVAAPGVDDSSWNVAQDLGDNQPYLGFITFRKTFTLPADWSSRDLMLQLGPVDDMDFTYLNGVKIGQTVGENKWSQPREYAVAKSLIKPGTNVLTVCVLNTGGPGGISGPVRLQPVGSTSMLELDHDWRFQTGTGYQDLPQLKISELANANTPSVLFNAMIAPLIPFGIRGAIWYQGESNVGRAAQYRRLFPAMIADWRRHWGEGDFPFYFVQI